jgi:molybdopterin-synthase adenylyltransferase
MAFKLAEHNRRIKIKMLVDSERNRYSRQIRLFGVEGQERLKGTSAFIAGAGGLGSAVSLYMAAAGFGRIVIADCDRVDTSNLNRQILHWTEDVGRSKARSAEETMKGLNPEIEIEALEVTIDDENVDGLLEGCDLIMDAMDNFSVRYLLNRTALRKRLPLFHGAISGFQGQATTILPGKTACLRCIFPHAPPAEIFPALGSTCGVIGSIQVTEAVKYVIGRGELLFNRLLLWDGLSSRMEEVSVEPDSRCRDCGDC